MMRLFAAILHRGPAYQVSQPLEGQQEWERSDLGVASQLCFGFGVGSAIGLGISHGTPTVREGITLLVTSSHWKSNGASAARFLRHTIHVCIPGVSIGVNLTSFADSMSRNFRLVAMRRSSVPQATQSSFNWLFADVHLSHARRRARVVGTCVSGGCVSQCSPSGGSH